MISTTAWQPSIEDPSLQRMPEPSLYGLQTQSTIPGDPHCFSGSTSSTVPLLLGTPGYLSSHGMMGQSMHGLQTQSTIPGVTESSGFDITTITHPPPGIPGYVSPFFTSQHAEWQSSYKWTRTKYGQSLQRICHKFIIGSTMIYINFWWQLCKFSNLYSIAIDLRCSLCIFTVILLYNVAANTLNPLRGWINNTTMYINSW